MLLRRSSDVKCLISASQTKRTTEGKEKEKEMTIEALERRERDAYEAFMEADWMHADMRLNEWLDAAHELNEAKGL